MLGRVAAVVIASLLAAAPALPQCTFTPVRSVQFRSSALDLSIDGNDLWLATSYGVSLYDRSVDPPKLVASTAVPGITRIVRAQNRIAYAGSGSSIVVIQRSGAHSLQITRSVDAGGAITDMVATPVDLYVASTAGLAQYDLLNPTNPAKASATFATSQPAVSSLALINSTLYAADGDSTISAFDISIPALPQNAGSLSAPTGINFIRANNGKLYASSGAIATYVFTGTGGSMANVGSGAFGTASLAPLFGDVAFMAGPDRRLHAVDFTVAGQPVEIFRTDLPPTNGTTNRIAALATANNRLYVAAGDIGLITFDTTGFDRPFPIHAYSTGSTTSILSLSDFVYVTPASGGITEFTQLTNGGTTRARSWDGSHADTVWDGTPGLILSSSGFSMTLWTTISATPQPVASPAVFRAPVTSAAVSGSTAFAVLSDRSLWSADFSASTPVPKQITIADLSPSAIARSGSSFVVEDLRDDGTTKLAYFATSDFTQTPKTASVPGVAITGVTLSGSTAALLTFQGITLVNFASGSTTVLPQSISIARSLVLDGTTLYELTDTSLLVWDTQKQTVVKQYTVPGDPIALDVAPSSTVADIATGQGLATVATAATTHVPASIGASNSNAYYKRVNAGASRIDLFDGRNDDIYNSTLRFINSLRGVTDVATNDNGVYTVSNGLVITSYTADGIPRGSFTIDSTGARALAIRTVGDAVWVSVESGCPACMQTTYVFDPRTGVSQTATMTGGVVDVVASGNRAHVITSQPDEVRVVNISDPFHPSTIISAAAPQSAISIAYANGTVYVLGDKLTSWAESTLTPIAEILGSYVPDPTGVVTSADQRVRIDGNCAVVVGRAFAPQLFTINSPSSWSAPTTFPMPSATRSIATEPGVLHFLTDHSLETWSTKPLPKPPRREAAR